MWRGKPNRSLGARRCATALVGGKDFIEQLGASVSSWKASKFRDHYFRPMTVDESMTECLVTDGGLVGLAKWSARKSEWHFQNVKSFKITNQKSPLTQSSIPLMPWTLGPMARFRLLVIERCAASPPRGGRARAGRASTSVQIASLPVSRGT